MAPGEQYVTAREIADRVGLSTDTILRYYRDGKIPGHRMPGRIRP
jgi:excisionase family DNA binding protein